MKKCDSESVTDRQTDTHTQTHTHNRFMALLDFDFVRGLPGELEAPLGMGRVLHPSPEFKNWFEMRHFCSKIFDQCPVPPPFAQTAPTRGGVWAGYCAPPTKEHCHFRLAGTYILDGKRLSFVVNGLNVIFQHSTPASVTCLAATLSNYVDATNAYRALRQHTADFFRVTLC